MFKKGQSMSINVIIVAVIALVIMVVLISIFAGRIGIVNQETDEVTSKSCREQGGRVISFGDSCGEQFQASFDSYEDVNSGYKCCMPIPYE